MFFSMFIHPSRPQWGKTKAGQSPQGKTGSRSCTPLQGRKLSMYGVRSKKGKPCHTCRAGKRSNMWGNPLDPSLPIGENPDNVGSLVPSRGNPRHIPNPHPAGKPAFRTNKQHVQGKCKLSLPQFNHSKLVPMYYNKIRGGINRETPVFKGDPDVLIIIPIVGNCDEMKYCDEKSRIAPPGGVRNRPPHRRSQLRWHPLHIPIPNHRLTIELFCAKL